MRLSFLMILLLGGLVITQAQSQVPASTPDTLWLRIVSKGTELPLTRLQVDLRKRQATYSVPENGRVALVGLEAGKYELYIHGWGFWPEEVKLKKESFNKKDTIEVKVGPHWRLEGSESLAFAQNAFGNYWQKGGVNSVAVRGEADYGVKFRSENASWENSLGLKYEVIKQGKNALTTSEDQLELNSKYGYRLSPHFLLSMLANLRSQLYRTYQVSKEGVREELRGRFLAPMFLNAGTGLDYKNKAWGLDIYYSPLNSKITVVRDTSLGPLYLPEALAGKMTRYELGSYLKIKFKKNLVKNVSLESKADFFANQLMAFGNIDVNWENRLTFKVNKYLSARLLTQVLYDNDILFTILGTDGLPETNAQGEPTGRKGPRTQFHQALNITAVHKF